MRHLTPSWFPGLPRWIAVRRCGRRRPEVLRLEDRILLSTSFPLNTSSWTALGPAPVSNGQLATNRGSAPVSGRITGIAPDPADPNTIYIAAAGGGVWKTTDGGGTWAPLTDNLADAAGNPIPVFMGAIAIDPLHPNIVYAGTGETNNSDDSFYGRGILKSSDGGGHWTLLDDGGTFERKTIARIVVDPHNDLNVYAAVDDNGFNGTRGNTGVYKSADGGQTWTPTTTAISTTDEYTDLVIDPNTPSTLYLAVGTAVPGSAGGPPAGSAKNGVYESTDSGNPGSWRPLTAAGLPGGTTAGRIALALAPDSSALYVAVASPAGPLLRLLKVTGGTTVTDLTPAVPDENYLGGQGNYDTALAVEPGRPNVVFASGASSFQVGATSLPVPDVIESTDGGATWRDITFDGTTGPHTDSHALAFDAAGRLLEGDDGGIFRLDPNGLRWTDLNGNLQITQFYGVALDPANADVAYGGSQDNGTEVFHDALGWNRVLAGDGGFPRVNPFAPATVYEELAGGVLLRSGSGGATPTPLSRPIGNTGQPPVPYVLDPSTANRVLFGTDILNESLDGGMTWQPIGRPNVNGFNPSDKPADDKAIDALAVAAGDPRTIYVTAGGHLFVTRNGTSGPNTTWTPADITGFTDSFAALAVDPADPGTAYAVRNAFTAPGTAGGHVFETTNGGATWTDVSGNLPNVPGWSIALDPRGAPAARTIYVGTDVGVYASADGGHTWAPYGAGLPNAQVRDLAIAPQLGILAAGTHGRGLYEIALAGPADPSASAVSVSPAPVEVLGATTVTLTARDTSGKQETGGGLTVAFALAGGSAGGTFGPVHDNGDGTYTAAFTATAAGQDTITATLNGQAVTLAAPILGVTGAPFSLARSAVTVSPGSVPAGSPATVTLTARDAGGAQEPAGGLTVVFALAGGSAGGTFGPVRDNGDGTYSASFIGSAAGQDTVTATINGQAVTAPAPAVTVTPGPPTVGTTSLADWTVNQVGYHQVVAASGTGTLTFRVSSGTLPPGLSLDSSTGIITGTPTATGQLSFDLTVTDAVGTSAPQAYTVFINPAPAISFPNLPGWTVGVSGYGGLEVGHPLAGSGTGALTFRVSAGSLPAGLSLNPTAGTLFGVPTAVGTSTVTVTVTDAAGAGAQQNYQVTINPAVTLSPAALPVGQLNQAYSAMVLPAGGTRPLFLGIAGTLPPGLTFNPVTGTLSGVPHAAGVFSFAVRAVDAVGSVAVQPYVFTVSPPTSTVNPLPFFSPPHFTVSWSGTAGPGLSIAFFDIYVSDNGGPKVPWLVHTTATSAVFPGQDGHFYAFLSVATDSAGTTQPFPADAQAVTGVFTPFRVPAVKVRRQKASGRGVTFLLTNTGPALSLPVALVLTGVSKKVTITNAAGVSLVVAPGSPFLAVAGSLRARARVRVRVRVRGKVRNPSLTALVFEGGGVL
jgi:hypothetical protein